MILFHESCIVVKDYCLVDWAASAIAAALILIKQP
jgi:hypothetical protein